MTSTLPICSTRALATPASLPRSGCGQVCRRHPGLVRRMGRYLLFVLAPILLASCATSPVTPREAESARVNSDPWDPDHHDATSGFTNRDLASLLNGLTGLAGH